MNYQRIFGIIFVLSLLLIPGCTSNNQQGVLQPPSEPSENKGVAQASGQSNQVEHCLCHMNEITYEFWFADEEATMNTVLGGDNIVIINKKTSCAYEAGISPQCVPVEEAGGFQEIKQSWLDTKTTLKCNCDVLEYSKDYFD